MVITKPTEIKATSPAIIKNIMKVSDLLNDFNDEVGDETAIKYIMSRHSSTIK